MGFLKAFSLSIAAFGVLTTRVTAYDNNANNNLAVYYGQNSYGATHSDTANWQKDLINYCQDDTITAIPLAFLHVFFSTGGLPEINMANTCNSNDNGVFAGTSLPNCQFLADDIKACQARGKIVTLSLGGATGGAIFRDNAQAEQFAQTIWNLFFAGSSSTRPFGDAVLDGIDLDIEGGSSTGLAALVNSFRSLAANQPKKYYVTAAPQCPYPDAYLQPALNAASFDAVYVQFYNNYCGLTSYGTGNWNFGQWDNWAKTVSINKNVKIFIGAPASSTASGSGYVDVNRLSTIARETKAQYSSFGGVMLWDVSQAWANARFDRVIKEALGGATGPTTPPPTSPPPTSPPQPPPTSPPTGNCNAAPWSASTTYVGGQYATYSGGLWQASWWTLGDTPGGAAGVWKRLQSCRTAPTSVPSSSSLFDNSGVAPVKLPREAPDAVVAAASEATPAPVVERRGSRVFQGL